MADDTRPDETVVSGSGKSDNAGRDDDLERRRRELDAMLATRRPVDKNGAEKARSSGLAGFGNALKISSEFVAGILVGVGLGWVIDSWAGTSPWGLIIFLLLGFAAGVLNVLRSVGMVADAGIRKPEKTGGSPPKT